MRTSDGLARFGGFLMLFTAAWNVLSSLLMFLALAWMVVGALWLVPLVLGGIELLLGVTFLALGHRRGVVLGPLLGLVIAICNLNPLGVALETGVLAVMIASSVARATEDAGGARRFA